MDLGCNAHRVVRIQRDVGIDGMDHYFVVFQVVGGSTIIQNDRTQDCLSHKQNESMVLKAALVCMVRHLRRELRHQRLAEFNPLLAWHGKADAKSVHRPQRDDALGQIGRLLDNPRRERVRIAQALVGEARLQRSIDQPRQRH
jgi:hypothetical protein